VRKIAKQIILGYALLVSMIASATFAAQDPGIPPSAPVPLQILNGKKVFVSNATGESIVPAGSGELTYNQFYASLKNWGRYELAAVPGDADLIFEIHYEAGSGWVAVYNGEGGSVQIPQIRLIILDPKTWTALWAFTEPVQQAAKKSTGMQNFQQAMVRLMGALKTLIPVPKAAAEK
jgi:hypothetical protein